MSLRKCVPLVALLLAADVAFAADEKPKQLKATNTWSGSVDDEKLAAEAPKNGVITSAKEFDKLVKAWKVAEKTPEVKFDKEIALVSTTPGSKLSLSATLDDKGDVKVLGVATRDLRPGFRYVIITVPKEGVKTVNGKELPKE
jgi:hypothetical protein